jgi:hypothetical protein
MAVEEESLVIFTSLDVHQFLNQWISPTEMVGTGEMPKRLV